MDGSAEKHHKGATGATGPTGPDAGASGATGATGATGTPAAEEPKEPTFEVEELLENARALTGRSRHFLAGALRGRKRITVSDAKELADEYAKRPVGGSDKENA